MKPLLLLLKDIICVVLLMLLSYNAGLRIGYQQAVADVPNVVLSDEPVDP